MHRSQRASPAIECCCRCVQIILKKSCVSVRAGKKPGVLVAALPGCSGNKWGQRSPCARAGQQATKEIPSRTKERDKPFANRPRIVAAAAIERRRRNLPVAARAGKKNIDLSAAYFQPSAQITRPRVLVGNPQRLPRTPLS